VLRQVRQLEKNVLDLPIENLAASFQQAIVDVLVQKTVQAAQTHNASAILLAGGVSANQLLRAELKQSAQCPVFVPPLALCTDNAAMIAAAGWAPRRSVGPAAGRVSGRDATDPVQIQELIILGELTQRAWCRNVQVMIEGPGHMALNEIAANMLLEKKLCHNAPFYVLGPLVTDVAPGYDHITSAIGGAVAGMYGADFLCYVTPAEHLRLPNLEDMVEGIIATKIAAHAADVAKGIPGAREWDMAMSQARAALDWESMFQLAIDREKPERYRRESKPEIDDSCSMCGKMCAVLNVKK
jgi:hypothetical protein